MLPTRARSLGRRAGVAIAVGALLATALGAPAVAATQPLDYCGTTTLAAGDDNSSDAVALPFHLGFFGDTYDELYVNNNGNVTFGSRLSQFTPSDLTGQTSVPIIAPFFADVDTRGTGTVTYGSSPDAKTFCVSWSHVGYFNAHDDKTATFQLLLTSRTGSAGRSAGDVDVTFNYDQVQWEAGDLSGGIGGLGGPTTAAAGFSAGSGADGTYVQLPGSLAAGALIDGGPKSLVAGSQSSTTAGRYVFEVRNAGVVSQYGSASGTVVDDGGTGVAGVQVELTAGSRAYFATTDATGAYAFTAVIAGTYAVRAFPTGNQFAPGGTAVIATNANTVIDPIVLRAPVGIQGDPNVSLPGIDPSYTADGVPIVYYGDPIPLRLTNRCTGANPATWTLTLDGAVVSSGSLTEGPAGTYSASIPAPYPAHGDGVVSYSLHCPNGGPVTTGGFDIYIDPSGIVVDDFGAPVAGATVTVLHSDTEDGTYTAVPDGDPMLSPSTRTNPSTTAADGRFRWDVAAGWYKVQVDVPGGSTVTTPAMQVPPERTELVIPISTTSEAPPAASGALTGPVRVGSTVSSAGLTWPDGVVVDQVKWFAETTQIGTGTSFKIPASALDHTLSARITGHREVKGNIDGFADQPTTYDFPFMRDVTAGPVAIGVLGLSASVTGTAVVGGTLGVKVTNPAGAALTYQWLRSGVSVAGATGATYVPKPGDVGAKLSVRVSGSKTGYLASTVTSAATKATVKSTALRATKAPHITGKIKVGSKLGVVGVVWSLKPTKVTYQWLRAGKPVAHATATTYRLTTADVGKRISVKLTATRAGYVTASTTTKATAAVPRVVPKVTAVLVKAKVSHTAHAKVTVTVTATGVSAPLGTVKVTYGKHSVSVKLSRSSHGTATVSLPLLKKGTYTITATYTPSGASAKVVRSATSRPGTLKVT